MEVVVRYDECYVCGDKFDTYLVEGNNTTVRCKNCRHFFTNPVLVSPAHLYENSAGEVSYQDFVDTSRKPIFDTVINQVNKNNKEINSKLLEIGSSVGRFLSLVPRYIDPYGSEMDKNALAFSQQFMKNCSATIDNFDVVFDHVVMIDTIEHIPDPGNLLQKVKGKMKENSYLYLIVPNGGIILPIVKLLRSIGITSISSDNHGHINMWSPRTLRLFLKRNGFVPIYEEVPPCDYYSMGGSLPKLFTPFYFHAKKLYFKIARMLFKITGLNITTSLFVVSKKENSSDGQSWK